MNNKWNNKSGAGVKRAVSFALAMVISVGMLTACTGGNSNRQDAVDRIPSSQSPQKNDDVKKNTAETTETPGQTTIQGTENKDLPAIDADKGTAPEVGNKETDNNSPKVEDKEADKNISDIEDKDIAEIEQNDTSSEDSDKNTAGEEKKDTAETEQKETEAEKNTEGKEQKETEVEEKEQKSDKRQTDIKPSTVDAGKK